MASATPSSTQPQLKLQLISQVGNEAIVRVNGQDYKFTVFKGHGNNWTDITDLKDWNLLAQHITEMFLENVGQPAFDSGEVILEGDFSHIDNPAPAAQGQPAVPITLVSAKVTLGGKDKEIDGNLTGISQPVQQKIQQKLAQISQDFQQIKPASSSRKAGAPNQPQKRPFANPHPPAKSGLQFEKVEENAVVKVLEGRSLIDGKEDRTAISALAEQLHTMPTRNRTVDYASIKDVKNIEKLIRRDVSSHIDDQKEHYSTDAAKFAALAQDLKVAFEKDTDCLVRNLQTLTSGALSTLLGKVTAGTALALDEKETLICTYARYVQDQGAKILNKTFFEAFIEFHSKKEPQQPLQVVIRSNDGKITTYLSKGITQIHAPSCAFLSMNKDTYECGSYVRANPFDLNSPTLTIDPKTTYKYNRQPNLPVPQRVIPEAVTTINVDSSGRCLDKSLAYQILKKVPQLNQEPQPNQITAVAEELRKTAANYIRNTPALNDDMLFMCNLQLAIQHAVEPSFDNQQGLPLPDGINAILANIEAAPQGMNAADAQAKTRLREYYASLIVSENGQPTNNFLDHAFLLALQMAPLPASLQQYLPQGLRIAVIQGSRLYSKYPQSEEIVDLADWLFVNYDGTLHFKAVKMTEEATKNQVINICQMS